MNIDTDADYVLEAYWWSHKLVDNVVKRKKKFVFACIAVIEIMKMLGQLEEMLALRDAFIVAYGYHPDGDVAVELTIKEELVNG